MSNGGRKELPKMESKRKELDDNSRGNSQPRDSWSSPISSPPSVSSALSPRTSMFPGMGDERTGDSKGFPTAVTHVRLLPRVPTHVVGERAGLSKALTAPIADVGLLAAVLPANEHRRQSPPGTKGSNTHD